MVALCLWDEVFQDHKMLFWCDKQAVLRVINRQMSHSELVMWQVRKMVLTCVLVNISFSEKYIPGASNGIVDALSRFQEGRFQQLAPLVHSHPEKFPKGLWSLGNT